MDSDIDSPSPRTLASLRAAPRTGGTVAEPLAAADDRALPGGCGVEVPPSTGRFCNDVDRVARAGPSRPPYGGPDPDADVRVECAKWHGGVRPYPSGSATEK